MTPILGAYAISYGWKPFSAKAERQKVIDEFSFELDRGEILALLGPNGSGKSTLLKLLSGILPRSDTYYSGQVRFSGKDFFSFSRLSRARKIAYVGSELKAEFPMTARETVMLGRTSQGHGFMDHPTSVDLQTIQSAMETTLSWHLRDRDFNTLSGGERQLVALAGALAQGAKVLFLDETFSKMDLNHQSLLGQKIKELATQGYSIILVAHDLNFAAELANRIIWIQSGKKIAEGPVSEMLAIVHLKKLYPGAQFFIGKNPSTGTPQVFFSL